VDIPEIDVDQLAERLDRGDGVLVDVRRPDEWDEAHIDGASLVTLDTLPDRIDELPSSVPLLVICRSGARSAVATKALVGAGYDATNVAGGMLAWIESGRDVARGEG
jgi:rhodanese-related sulfurtransferase